MRKSPVLVELHLQLSAKKGSFLDHLENNTIEFARFLGDCTCENRWYSSYSNANKKR
jgi:hypothetical protein